MQKPTTDKNVKEVLSGAMIENCIMRFYDDFVEVNVEERAKAGLRQIIIREAMGTCCDWCSKLVGIYEYGSEPREVYQRHDNCNCVVTHRNGKTYTDVWSKQTYRNQREARYAALQDIEERLTSRRKLATVQAIKEETRIRTDADVSRKNRLFLPQIEKLDDKEKTILKEYTGFKATELNDAMWRGDQAKIEKYQTKIDEMHDILKNGIIPEDMTVWRNTAVEYILKDGKTLAELKEKGEPITMAAFTSTSLRSDLNLRGRNATIELRVKKGHKGAMGISSVAHSKYKNQMEVLFDKGMKFRILEYSEEYGHTYIAAEVVK